MFGGARVHYRRETAKKPAYKRNRPNKEYNNKEGGKGEGDRVASLKKRKKTARGIVSNRSADKKRALWKHLGTRSAVRGNCVLWSAA